MPTVLTILSCENYSQWNSRRRLPGLFCLIILLVGALSGCARYERDTYKGYGGPDQPDEKVATVQSVSAYLAAIDGKRLKHSDPHKFYDQAKLLPGSHVIWWGKTFYVSVLVDPRGLATYEKSATINLKRGHVYTLHADRTTGPGYRAYLWIEDATTGGVIAGQRRE